MKIRFFARFVSFFSLILSKYLKRQYACPSFYEDEFRELNEFPLILLQCFKCSIKSFDCGNLWFLKKKS